jgi:GNAT superfamily N-acetyltransferase
MNTSAELTFRTAEAADIPAIVALVESAYRGESGLRGWTTESHLLDGRRTNDEDVGAVMFAVDPTQQGGGLGKAVLAEAERLARERWQCRAMRMTVIEQRQELIAWYERRGYLRTAQYEPFPYGDERFGIPLRPDLRFEVLVKTFAKEPA